MARSDGAGRAQALAEDLPARLGRDLQIPAGTSLGAYRTAAQSATPIPARPISPTTVRSTKRRVSSSTLAERRRRSLGSEPVLELAGHFKGVRKERCVVDRPRALQVRDEPQLPILGLLVTRDQMSVGFHADGSGSSHSFVSARIGGAGGR